MAATQNNSQHKSRRKEIDERIQLKTVRIIKVLFYVVRIDRDWGDNTVWGLEEIEIIPQYTTNRKPRGEGIVEVLSSFLCGRRSKGVRNGIGQPTYASKNSARSRSGTLESRKEWGTTAFSVTNTALARTRTPKQFPQILARRVEAIRSNGSVLRVGPQRVSR